MLYCPIELFDTLVTDLTLLQVTKIYFVKSIGYEKNRYSFYMP